MVTAGRWPLMSRKREVARNSWKESKARAMDGINELADRVGDGRSRFAPSSLCLCALSGSRSEKLLSHELRGLPTEALDSEDATETSGEEVAFFA